MIFCRSFFLLFVVFFASEALSQAASNLVRDGSFGPGVDCSAVPNGSNGVPNVMAQAESRCDLLESLGVQCSVLEESGADQLCGSIDGEGVFSPRITFTVWRSSCEVGVSEPSAVNENVCAPVPDDDGCPTGFAEFSDGEGGSYCSPVVDSPDDCAAGTGFVGGEGAGACFVPEPGDPDDIFDDDPCPSGFDMCFVPPDSDGNCSSGGVLGANGCSHGGQGDQPDGGDPGGFPGGGDPTIPEDECLAGGGIFGNNVLGVPSCFPETSEEEAACEALNGNFGTVNGQNVCMGADGSFESQCASVGGFAGSINGVMSCVDGDGNLLDVPEFDEGDEDSSEVPTDEPGDGDQGSVSPSGGCDGQRPTCTSGDIVACAILQQDYDIFCGAEEFDVDDFETGLTGNSDLMDANSIDEEFMESIMTDEAEQQGLVSAMLDNLVPPNAVGVTADAGCFSGFSTFETSMGNVELPVQWVCIYILPAISAVLYISTYITAGWILFNSLRD